MPPEVVAAIEYGSKQFVSLNELQDKVGERLAKLLGRSSYGDLRCGRCADLRHCRLRRG